MCAKNHRWGLEPIQTCPSAANHAGLHAQNDRWGLGPISTCYSGPKVAVLHSKTTDEGWDPERHVILVQKSLFCIQKPQMRAGTHRDLLFWSKSRYFACKNHRWGLGPLGTSNSCTNDAFLHAQNDRWYLGPIETCCSGPKAAVFHPKTTDEGRDP